MDLISKLTSMSIGGGDRQKAEGEQEEEKNFFTLSNPVFQQTNISSKVKNVVDEVTRVSAEGQKSVIVSQWTSMLEVFALHLSRAKIRCHLIAGNVNVKQRTLLVEDFNTNPDGPPVCNSITSLKKKIDFSEIRSCELSAI